MSDFGWTRLAYLTVILAVLAVLVKLGTFGASSLPESLPESAFAFAQKEQAVEETVEESRHDGPEHGEHAEDERPDEHPESEHPEASHSHEPVESTYENVDFREDAPVFYRPAPRVGSASRSPSSKAASCQTLEEAPAGSKILFPVPREHFDSYEDTWGAARPQGGHEGTDLMVPTGTPLLAMTDGRIVPVSGANGNGWNTLGGYTVMLEAAYSVGPVKQGDLFYYAHMDRQSDLRIGDTVKAGDVVGYAGDTGQGPEGARGQFPPHLHLGWYETSGQRTQLASGAMNPYPLLEWVKANGGAISGGSDIPYCEAPQPAAPTPSTGGYWQFPSDPGVRPDMSTGTDNAAPSPVAEENHSSESSPGITREERRPVRPNRPAPPQDETDRPNAPPPTGSPSTDPPSTGSPSTGTPSTGSPSTGPPSISVPPLLGIPSPLPDLGGGIRDLIGGILNPANPAPPSPSGNTNRPTVPAPPPEDEQEDTAPEVVPPEEGCEPHEHADEEETNEEDLEDGEGCPEDGGSGEGGSPDDGGPTEETTGPNSSGAVEEQYDHEDSETEDPETTSGP